MTLWIIKVTIDIMNEKKTKQQHCSQARRLTCYCVTWWVLFIRFTVEAVLSKRALEIFVLYKINKRIYCTVKKCHQNCKIEKRPIQVSFVTKIIHQVIDLATWPANYKAQSHSKEGLNSVCSCDVEGVHIRPTHVQLWIYSPSQNPSNKQEWISVWKMKEWWEKLILLTKGEGQN